MPVKALIFDFDLTLADATHGIFECMCHALDQLGFPLASFDKVKKTIGHSLKDSFTILTGNNDAETVEKFVTIYVAHADKVMNKNTSFYPEVFKTIPQIKQKGFKTAIVSTKYRYRIEAVLERDKLNQYFDFIIGGEDVKIHKPDPEGLLLAVEKLEINKSEVLYIGDSIIDAQAAENAGLNFCGVLTGTTTTNEFKQLQVVNIINNLDSLFSVPLLNTK